MLASHSAYSVPLPKITGRGKEKQNEKELSDAIQRLVRTGLYEAYKHLPEWFQCDAFLRGQRNTSYSFVPGGYVEATYEDESGELQLSLEYALTMYSIERGRLGMVDTRPRLSPKGFGLNAVRSAGIAQGLMEHLVSDQMVASSKAHLLPLLLKTGTAGIAGWAEKFGQKTYGRIEVIHPRELMSIPARLENSGELIGVMRRRTVPFDWAVKQPKFKDVLTKMSENILVAKLGASYQSYGYIPDTTLYHTQNEEAFLEPDNQMGGWSKDESSASPNKAKTEKGTMYLRLNEIYLLGEDRTLSRYIAHAGDTVIIDIDYAEKGVRVPMPIGLVRYTDIGSFFGRSFLYPLVTLNRELEETYKITLDMLQDNDQLGMTFIPSTLGISHRDLKQTTKPRAIFYEPTWDMGTHQLQPFHVNPVDLSGLPISIAQVLTEMMNLQSGQSAIYHGAAPGRVDSAASIQALTETGNTGLRGPIDSIAEGYAQAYASVLYQAKELMGDSGEAIHMRSLDPRILGVVIDPRAGTLSLEKNPLPDWESVNIGIESEDPKSRGQRMAELNEELQKGTLSPSNYRIIARREQLDLPIASDGEWETYRMTMLNIRLLFGDGENPGKALVRADVDTISVAEEYLLAFMKSPEFALASMPVKTAFEDVLLQYREAQGQFPEGLPPPDLLGALAGEADQAGPPQGVSAPPGGAP